MGSISIVTTRFGTIEIEEDLIIQFVEPILGFDEQQRFIVLDHSDNSPFKWLQSLDIPDLAFVISNPKLFGMDYEFAIPDEVAQKLNVETAEDVLVVTIVNIPADDPSKMTTNLLGPIIINQAAKKAMQVVLNDSSYSTRTRLIPDETLGAKQPSAVGPEIGE